jgi:hypothetical protein
MRVPLSVLALLACTAVAPSPEPTPSPVTLPEIGRTRSASPSCAAMRDLIIPAFAAARRADMRFEGTRKQLSQYAVVSADSATRIGNRTVENSNVFRESALARIGSDAANLLQESQTIKMLLDDPRLAPTSQDAQVQAERANLERIYDVQQARAVLLNQFAQRESMAMGRQGVGMGDNSGIGTKLGNAGSDLEPPPAGASTPVPSAAPGMPQLTGFDLEDRRRMGEWGARMALAVRASENEAAKTFLSIAQNCH